MAQLGCVSGAMGAILSHVASAATRMSKMTNFTHMPGVWAEMAKTFEGGPAPLSLHMTRLGFLTV